MYYFYTFMDNIFKHPAYERIPEVGGEVFQKAFIDASLGRLNDEMAKFSFNPAFRTQLKPGDYFVEVPCGVGHQAYLMAENLPDVRVFGFDISKYAIERGQGSFSRENLTLEVRDLYEGQVISGTGIIQCSFSLHEMDLEKAARGFYNMIECKGVVSFFDYNRGYLVNQDDTRTWAAYRNATPNYKELFAEDKVWVGSKVDRLTAMTMDSQIAAHPIEDIINAFQQAGFDQIDARPHPTDSEVIAGMAIKNS